MRIARGIQFLGQSDFLREQLFMSGLKFAESIRRGAMLLRELFPGRRMRADQLLLLLLVLRRESISFCESGLQLLGERDLLGEQTVMGGLKFTECARSGAVLLRELFAHCRMGADQLLLPADAAP